MNRPAEVSWSTAIAEGLVDCNSNTWQIEHAQSDIRYLDVGLGFEELQTEEDSLTQSEAGRGELLSSSASMGCRIPTQVQGLRITVTE